MTSYSLANILERAGFLIPPQKVMLPNFVLPLMPQNLHNQKFGAPLPDSQPHLLRPWENDGSHAPKISFYYFWALDCAPCETGLQELQQLSNIGTWPPTLNLKTIVSDVDAFVLIRDKLASLNVTLPVLLDSNGGFAERAAVLATPASLIVDELGQVVAYLNGPIDFDSPAFEAALARLGQHVPNPYSSSLSDELLTKVSEDRQSSNAAFAHILQPSLYLIAMPFLCFLLLRILCPKFLARTLCKNCLAKICRRAKEGASGRRAMDIPGNTYQMTRKVDVLENTKEKVNGNA